MAGQAEKKATIAVELEAVAGIRHGAAPSWDSSSSTRDNLVPVPNTPDVATIAVTGVSAAMTAFLPKCKSPTEAPELAALATFVVQLAACISAGDACRP
ncbi:hypothetical protein OPT61_g1982 [Boeremia exigua]|uniref:Uncharacterized protein n=1 Tax=Boeremia exigua TaxID=749465 RepID=A0ACC2INE8_9PLEO|nr:hypothetical protein OPT61_g1982 [Boeremia exigua]